MEATRSPVPRIDDTLQKPRLYMGEIGGATAQMPAPVSATCVYRFLGLVPRPGEPLLVDDDPAGVMGQKATVEVAGRSIAVRVNQRQDHVLDGDAGSQLRKALHENHTYNELLEWAKGLTADEDRITAVAAIAVAKRANDKGHVARTLLPSRRALFLGIVAPNQPPVAVTAPFGLNHARVIVEGVVPIFNFNLVPGGHPGRMPLAGDLAVCGVKVGRIIDGRCILVRSGVPVQPVQTKVSTRGAVV